MRWVVAVPVFICSVAVLVVSGFALYYAHKASTENIRAGVARTSANVRRQLAETERLIKQANQAVAQMQQNAQNAGTNASSAQQSLTKAVAELQQSVDQANQSLAEGKSYDIYVVNIDGVDRSLALFKPGRAASQFIDPANPGAAPIAWQGSWRTLERAWTLAPAWGNFADVWASSTSRGCCSTRSRSRSSG